VSGFQRGVAQNKEGGDGGSYPRRLAAQGGIYAGA
jgi:hypothetical protein